jgi:hypothetical protein
MFERIKQAFGRAADAVRRFAGITNDAAEKVERFNVEVAPLLPIRYRIPRSSFTKTGPGVRAALRRVLVAMTPTDRLIARAKGWDRGMVTWYGGIR